MKNFASLQRWTAVILACVAFTASGFAFRFILNKNTGIPVKWPATPSTLPLRIMLGTGATTSDTNFNQAAKAAADLWNARIGAIQFQSTLAAAGTDRQDNGSNDLFFSDTVFGTAFGENVLAVTSSFSRGNERTGSDIVFNNKDFTWDSYRGGTQSGKIDLRRVAIHELGHVLGLDHPDEDSPAQPKQAVSAIMNSRVSSLDTLTDDDITGGQLLYGPPGVPANNNFASATVIGTFNGALTVTGYNTNATKESGEPSHAGNVGGRSVWWRWTPSNSGTATIDTRGSYFDTLLAIYTGSTLANLNLVASDDDIVDGVVQAGTVDLNVVGGTTYQIAVDGFNNVVQDARDTAGADNAGIKLNILYNAVSGSAPSILTQPSGATVSVGGNASFSVSATGSDPLSYQWLFNGVAIAGATSSSLNLNNVQAADGGVYAVTVTNAAGSVTSNNVSLTVRASTPTPTPTPTPSSGGGGGGGAPSAWFLAMLAALGVSRILGRRPL